jgi:hypothetical protein
MLSTDGPPPDIIPPPDPGHDIIPPPELPTVFSASSASSTKSNWETMSWGSGFTDDEDDAATERRKERAERKQARDRQTKNLRPKPKKTVRFKKKPRKLSFVRNVHVFF